MSGLASKLGDRAQTSGKPKFLSQNINAVFAGKSALPSKAVGPVGKHGLQSVGSKQTAVVRRMPPPVHLPSLRAESSALGSSDPDPSHPIQPSSTPSWAPDNSTPPPPGPQPLIPKLRDPQPRWMSDGPSPRDFPSLATASDPKLALDATGPVLRPQKVGSWKSGGAGGAGKDEQNPPPPHPPNGVEEGRRSASPQPYRQHPNNFNPPFVSQRPPPPPQFQPQNYTPRPPQPQPLLPPRGYDRDYHEGPPPRGRDYDYRYGPPQHDRPYSNGGNGAHPNNNGPRHYDDYPPPPQRGPGRTDEEQERKDGPPRQRQPNNGRGDGDFPKDHHPHPPPSRDYPPPEQYREFDERYEGRGPPRDMRGGYGPGPPMPHPDYRPQPHDRYPPDWYHQQQHQAPPYPPQPHHQQRQPYYPDQHYGEMEERRVGPRVVEDEEEEERRLRAQQEREREAAIQRSRQKRRNQGQSEGGVEGQEEEIPVLSGPREVPRPEHHHRRPQTTIPPRFQRHNDEHYHPPPLIDPWDEEGYAPLRHDGGGQRGPDQTNGEERRKENRKPPRQEPPKRTERGEVEEKSWRPAPKETKEVEKEDDDDAPQLQSISRAKAVKRTPQNKTTPAPKPQPVAEPEEPVVVEPAPEPEVNIWEKRAEEARESQERQVDLPEPQPLFQNRNGDGDEFGRGRGGRGSREFYNSSSRRPARNGDVREMRVQPPRTLRGRGGGPKRGGSVPLIQRRDEEEEEMAEDVVPKENGDKSQQPSRGARRGDSARPRRGGLQYPSPGYYFQPPPDGPGPNPFGAPDQPPYMGPGTRGDRRGRGRGRGGRPERARKEEETSENGKRKEMRRGRKKEEEMEPGAHLAVPGSGLKSPNHSEGQEEWETASESSDVGLRQPESTANDNPNGAPQRYSKREPRQAKPLPKNAKPASRQMPPTNAKGADALAGVDIQNIAGVIAIDDQPDSAAPFLWDTEEFQEVVSRKEKRLRSKQETMREKRETRSASNRAGPDRRQRNSPPPKSSAPPLIPPHSKPLQPPQPLEKAKAPVPIASEDFITTAFWSETPADNGVGVAAAFEDYVKKSNWGASPSKEDTLPSKTGTEIWGTPDPHPFSSKSDPDRPAPAKSVEFPAEFPDGPSPGGGLDFTFDPSLPTPAFNRASQNQTVPVRAPEPVASSEDDVKLSQRLNLVRKVWADDDPRQRHDAPDEADTVVKDPPQVAKVNPLPQASPQATIPSPRYVQGDHSLFLDPHGATGPLGKAFYASTAASPPMLGGQRSQPDFSHPPPSQPPMFSHPGAGIWQGGFSQPPPHPPPVFSPANELFSLQRSSSSGFYPGPFKPTLFTQPPSNPFLLDGSTPHSLMHHAPVFGPIGSQRPTGSHPPPSTTQQQANNSFFLTASPQQQPPPHHNLFGGQASLLGPPPNQNPGNKYGGPFGGMGPPPQMGPPPTQFGMGQYYNGRSGPPGGHMPLSQQSSGQGLFNPTVGHPHHYPPPSSTPQYQHPHHHNGYNGGGVGKVGMETEVVKVEEKKVDPPPPAESE